MIKAKLLLQFARGTYRHAVLPGPGGVPSPYGSKKHKRQEVVRVDIPQVEDPFQCFKGMPIQADAILALMWKDGSISSNSMVDYGEGLLFSNQDVHTVLMTGIEPATAVRAMFSLRTVISQQSIYQSLVKTGFRSGAHPGPCLLRYGVVFESNEVPFLCLTPENGTPMVLRGLFRENLPEGHSAISLFGGLIPRIEARDGAGFQTPGYHKAIHSKIIGDMVSSCKRYDFARNVLCRKGWSSNVRYNAKGAFRISASISPPTFQAKKPTKADEVDFVANKEFWSSGGLQVADKLRVPGQVWDSHHIVVGTEVGEILARPGGHSTLFVPKRIVKINITEGSSIHTQVKGSRLIPKLVPFVIDSGEVIVSIPKNK